MAARRDDLAGTVLPKLEGHAADLRPASASEEATSFGRVEAAGGVLLTRGGGIYDVHEKVAFSAGMCASRFFEARSGAGKRRGGRVDKLTFLHK